MEGFGGLDMTIEELQEMAEECAMNTKVRLTPPLPPPSYITHHSECILLNGERGHTQPHTVAGGR
jgi:hypothetical protein